MAGASHFARAVEAYYTCDQNIIEFYSNLYNEMHENKLLDENFISQMSDADKTMQRLSELVVLKYCTQRIKGISSEKKGPDITFSFESKRINIEVITPIQVVQKKTQYAQYFFPHRPEDPAPGSSVDAYTPEMDSLHARITSALKEKAGKYEAYLNNETTQSDDINIICINVGFIQGNELIDYAYLKNLFTRQATIYIDIDEQKKISPKIVDIDFQVTKENSTILTTSYFDNSAYAHIDGAWIISCNEKNFDSLAQVSHPANMDRNVMHQNMNSRIPSSLLSALHINSPQQEESFVQHIRAHGQLPNA
ncbi:hypothetical protein AOA59_22760 [Pseudomonas sp. 2822-15]|uniref:hypothetical protein n=1 Tax=Pseudomonas sp. 2822-15 TaxID=1712677 RepID=UPI000C16176C|nr:hypothetical protein [Pseudomonas sp. 2822-15]PIB42175.1 hypothetical protein AOA59_22760 [Pseudomonas sp. 2822-15]